MNLTKQILYKLILEELEKGAAYKHKSKKGKESTVKVVDPKNQHGAAVLTKVNPETLDPLSKRVFAVNPEKFEATAEPIKGDAAGEPADDGQCGPGKKFNGRTGEPCPADDTEGGEQSDNEHIKWWQMLLDNYDLKEFQNLMTVESNVEMTWDRYRASQKDPEAKQWIKSNMKKMMPYLDLTAAAFEKTEEQPPAQDAMQQALQQNQEVIKQAQAMMDDLEKKQKERRIARDKEHQAREKAEMARRKELRAEIQAATEKEAKVRSAAAEKSKAKVKSSEEKLKKVKQIVNIQKKILVQLQKYSEMRPAPGAKIKKLDGILNTIDNLYKKKEYDTIIKKYGKLIGN